jgi:hypothetical protein
MARKAAGRRRRSRKQATGNWQLAIADPPSGVGPGVGEVGQPRRRQSQPLRSEYVIAYLQLGFRTATDLTRSDFVAAGVSHATSQDAAYVVSATNVGDIADAHFSIAAARASGTNVTSALQKLRAGNFRGAKIANAPCGTCPGECACSPAAACVAPWRAH